MAVIASWGLARKIFLQVFTIQSEKAEMQYKWLVGNELNTTQEYEIFKQMRGLQPAELTNEGESVKYDDYSQLFAAQFKPRLYTKGLKYTELADFTNQYKDIIAKQPDFARSFVLRRNIACAALYNLGFTDTTYGMNNETLFSTTHQMGSFTGSNTPTVNYSFSPLGCEQVLIDLRLQKGADNQPMNLTGKVQLMVPPQLEGQALRAVNAIQLAGGNWNDPNQMVRSRISLEVCDFFTSSTAFFARMMDNSQHHLFLLKQMGYDIKQLAMTDDFYFRYAARESYIPGWSDWHGTYGVLGF
jgi:hypothetical protein